MSRHALLRLIRVAEIIAQDARQRDNQERAKEIIALAKLVEKDLEDDGTHEQAPATQ